MFRVGAVVVFENHKTQKTELNYLTMVLKGRKVKKTHFCRDALDGLITFTVSCKFSAKVDIEFDMQFTDEGACLKGQCQKTQVLLWVNFEVMKRKRAPGLHGSIAFAKNMDFVKKESQQKSDPL